MTGPAGVVIAAPTSAAGKTVVTLGLLRALTRAGYSVAGAKSGPDYIDPGFHRAACGAISFNLDAWAMTTDTLRACAGSVAAETLLIEGAMGVLDGAAGTGRGSAADLAAALGVPVVLVIDAARQGQSVALAAAGLRALRPEVRLAGVILNRVGSLRHASLCRTALTAVGVTVLGAVPRTEALSLPERHLGLVQADERAGLEDMLNRAADHVEAHVDLAGLLSAATPITATSATPARLPPLGQRIAVARDIAFAFAYPHLLADWQSSGAQIMPFSPLRNEAPDPTADAVFLPGGYPELHAGQLAGTDRFRAGMQDAAKRGARIYGECGGYMVLGRALTDASGTTHPMLGLLPVETSFATRALSLGYRHLSPQGGAPWSGPLTGHEFHYATLTSDPDGARLFTATEADGTRRPPMGHQVGRICGSFAHVIGPAPV